MIVVLTTAFVLFFVLQLFDLYREKRRKKKDRITAIIESYMSKTRRCPQDDYEEYMMRAKSLERFYYEQHVRAAKYYQGPRRGESDGRK